MPQAPFGLQFGLMPDAVVPVVGNSLYAGDIVIAVENIGSFTITPTAVGIDAPSGHDYFGKQAGFVGSVRITGLVSFTSYNYVATQGSNTITGELTTIPSATDDFALAFLGCDNNTNNQVQAGGKSDGNRGMKQLRNYAENGKLKLAAIVHHDDHGYFDGNGLDDSAGTGHKQSNFLPIIGLTEYDHMLGAFCNYGLYSEQGGSFAEWGHDEDRQWLWKNVAKVPQWGDHDAGSDDMHWDQDALATPFKEAYAFANIVWDTFFKPLQGDFGIQNRDTGARHFGLNIGCIKFLFPDGITNATGDAVDASPWDTVPTIVYGSNQVDDCLDFIDVEPMPFTALTMNYSIRHLKTPTTQQNGGAQNPIGTHADYARFMTSAGQAPKSMMDNPRTNGASGCMFTLHGDNHQYVVTRNDNTGGAIDEMFHSICVSTINGSLNFSSGLLPGDSKDGSTVIAYDSGGFEGHEGHYTILEVYGSRSPKEVHITSKRVSDDALIWSGKFMEGAGNFPYAIDAPVAGSTSADGSIGMGV